MPWDFIHMGNINKTNDKNKFSGTENKLVVTRGKQQLGAAGQRG